MYIDAYGSTELTADEVWEEAICDALGFMNIFEGFSEEGDAAVFLMESGRAASEVREETKAAKGQKFSIETLPDGKKYVRADRQVIFGNDAESWSEQLERYINGKIRNGQDVVLIGADGDELRLTATSAGKLSDNHTSDGRTMSDTAYERKVNAATHIDELAQTSKRKGSIKPDTGNRHGDFASDGWMYRTAYFMDFDGKYYRVTISAAINSDGNTIYNIGQMKEEASPKVKGSRAKTGDGPRGFASSNNSVSGNNGSVKQKFSRELDSDGRKLTEAQREFFKDSKVRDDEGRLLPVYHSTYAEDFTVFDRGRLGENTDGNATDESLAATSHVGFWFNTEDLSRNSRLGSRTENVYLNITAPFDAGNLDQLADRMNQFEGTPTERGEAFADWLRGDGYDGVVLRDEEFGGTSYVVLEPQQIKRVTNQSPTLDSDIRFSRELSIDRLNEENDLLQQTIEGFRESGETSNTVSEQDAEKVARKIIKEYSGTITVDDISGDVRELSGMIARGDWDAAKAKAMEISQGTRSSLLLTKAIIFMAKAPIR